MKFKQFVDTQLMNSTPRKITDDLSFDLDSEIENEMYKVDSLCCQKIQWLKYCEEHRETEDVNDEDIFNVLTEIIYDISLCIDFDSDSYDSLSIACSLASELFQLCKDKYNYSNDKLEAMDDRLLIDIDKKFQSILNTKAYDFETMIHKITNWFEFRRAWFEIINTGLHPLESSVPNKFYNKYKIEFKENRKTNYKDIALFGMHTLWIYMNDPTHKHKALAVECYRDMLVAAQSNGYSENEEGIKEVIEALKNDDYQKLRAMDAKASESHTNCSIDQQVSAIKESLSSFLISRKALLDSKYAKLQESIADMEIEDLDQPSFIKELEDCRVLILTANECEDKVITRMLYEDNGSKALSKQAFNGYRIKIGVLGKVKAAHVHQKHSGSSSDDGSEAAVRFATNYFQPKLVLSLGVAYGVDCDNQELGDVLFSVRIIDVDKWNKKTDGKYQFETKSVYESSSQIMASWEHFLKDRNYMKDFDWHIGAILSKGTVLSDPDEKRALLDAAKDIKEAVIGGEMEGSGIVRACENLEGLRWLVVKGICDWGEQKNALGEIALELGFSESNDDLKDSIQAYAAENAYIAIKTLLSKAPSALN